jgi:HSP20 family protein
MAKAGTKLTVKTGGKAEPMSALRVWRPFETLHREIDRLFDDFDQPPISREVMEHD